MATTKEILALTVEIADVMLRNGSEIYRIEDTVVHILKAYNVAQSCLTICNPMDCNLPGSSAHGIL